MGPPAAGAGGETAPPAPEPEPELERVRPAWDGGVDVARVVLVCLAVVTRTYALLDPAEYQWDEVYFVMFAAKYRLSWFYTDVHPPLGLLLYYGAALAEGYNDTSLAAALGTRPKIQTPAPPDQPFASMRCLAALFGVGICALAYEVLRRSGASRAMAVLGTLLVIFDNAVLQLGRLVLLDPIMLFFCLLSVHCFLGNLQTASTRAPTAGWSANQFRLGLALVCYVSTKHVGLFLVLAVGAHTSFQLGHCFFWAKQRFVAVRRFAVQVVALILVPILIYLALCAAHLTLLHKSPPRPRGELNLPIAFQQQLDGGRFTRPANATEPLHVAADSRIALSQALLPVPCHLSCLGETAVCLPAPALHWQLLAARTDRILASTEPVHVGDTMVLQFQDDGGGPPRHLAVAPAPLAAGGNSGGPGRVVCRAQGEATAFDAAGQWQSARLRAAVGSIMEIVLSDAEPRLAARESVVRLTNMGAGQHLGTTSDGGLTGDPDAEVSSPTLLPAPNLVALWHVSATANPRLERDLGNGPAAARARPLFSLLGRIWDFHTSIRRIHKCLVVADDSTAIHPCASRPLGWPLRQAPIELSTAALFRGNAVVWAIGLAAILASLALELGRALLWGCGLRDSALLVRTAPSAEHRGLVVAWALHYLPFFGMPRQLYLHHYLPALVFSLLAAALLLDHAVAWAVGSGGPRGSKAAAGRAGRIRHRTALALGAAVLAGFAAELPRTLVWPSALY